MKHHTYTLILILNLLCPIFLTLSLSTKAQTRPPRIKYDPNSWKEFSPDNGRFSILLPGAPKQNNQSIGTLTNQVYTLDTSSADFVIGFADLPLAPVEDDEIKKLFDRGINGIITEKGGKLISDKAIMLGRYPGREYILEAVGTPATILKARVYLVDKRLYQIVVVQPKIEGRPQSTIDYYNGIANKFLDSFKLL
jgi:hypothetical protein